MRKTVLPVAKDREPYRTELTPVSFLRRSAYLMPDKTAVVHGERRYTYRQFEERVNRLASRLRALGLRHLDRVAIIAPNTPAMLDAHFGVPAAGMVLVRSTSGSTATRSPTSSVTRAPRCCSWITSSRAS
jgi:acyl-CoA synthetase (AMP-forming)/AMP-acid ligase II